MADHFGTGPQHDLPAGWSASVPAEDDVEDLVRLLRRHEQDARGWPGADSENVSAEVTGRGARTRTHLLVRDDGDQARAWVSCHDRAAGRVLVGVTVDPELDDGPADAVADFCFAQAEQFAEAIGAGRGLASTQMDAGAFREAPRLHRWLRRAGFEHVRDWWQMSRPVDPAEATAMPAPRAGVQVRRVRRDDQVGMPQEQDLRDVHFVLEESFADHFNSYRETFEEFVGRLREDPGHRWDHWWLATVDGAPGGALVATTITGRLDAAGAPQPDGSYVDYIGVHRRARGRGVAKSPPTPRHEGAAGSASRSTATRPPGPTASTPLWAGARHTSRSRGTRTSRSRHGADAAEPSTALGSWVYLPTERHQPSDVRLRPTRRGVHAERRLPGQ